MTKEEQEEFTKLTMPLMEWLRATYNPHMTVIINSESAELVEGLCCVRREIDTETKVDYEAMYNKLIATVESLKAENHALAEYIKQSHIARVKLGKQRNAFKLEVIKLRNDIVDIETGDQNLRIKDATAHRAKIDYLKEENVKLKESLNLLTSTTSIDNLTNEN